MNLRVLPFTMALYDRVLELWQQCEGIGLGDSDSRENIALFLERNPGMSFVVESEKILLGAVMAGHDGRRGYIHHLAVLPDRRRKGVGRILVENCLKSLKNAGILKCHIFIFNQNENGLKFWESVGWSVRKDISIVSKFID